MHHCVGTYGRRVAGGDCYIYGLRKGEQRIATIELVEMNGKAVLGQIRGPSNAAVSKPIKLAARKWLKAQKQVRLPEKSINQPIVVPQDRPEIRLPEPRADHAVAANAPDEPLTPEEQDEVIELFQSYVANRL